MDALRSAWQHLPGSEKQPQELRGMLQEGQHPVLKQLRRQVIIESLLFSIFLAVYYNMFDGHRRPFWLNALLVAGVLLVVLHGLAGYFNAKRPVKAAGLQQALAARLRQLKTFAILSVALRVLSMACILLFFTYTITFTVEKEIILGWVVLATVIQFIILAALWNRRIRRLGEAVEELKG
ncbi:hypothetical protein [Chitinophaga alhagiae]|uniref:hypothetical protein n=1 Tax=Chitinophaga alhagiae TaxID=2203219 RepID=UPI0013004B24|nr:hypothetical protein [Chitinophaga alhagiae]